MKFTPIKTMLLACLTLGLAGSAFAADWRSYLQSAKSGLGRLWSSIPDLELGGPETAPVVQPSAPEPTSAAASSAAAEPVVVEASRPISSSRAETSAGASASEPQSPSLSRAAQVALQKVASSYAAESFPMVVSGEGTECVQSILEDLTDYIALVKGMYTRFDDANREIETKTQMQEAVYRLLQFKRLLINKLPRDENGALLRESEKEIDDWKHSMPFHTRHYDTQKGYRTQEEIFQSRRSTPRSPIYLSPVPQRMFPGTNVPAPKVQLGEVPHMITADQFGHETSGLGAATAMGHVASMSPEQEAELRERMAPSSSSEAYSSQYSGYEQSPEEVFVQPLVEGQE